MLIWLLIRRLLLLVMRLLLLIGVLIWIRYTRILVLRLMSSLWRRPLRSKETILNVVMTWSLIPTTVVVTVSLILPGCTVSSTSISIASHVSSVVVISILPILE